MSDGAFRDAGAALERAAALDHQNDHLEAKLASVPRRSLLARPLGGMA